MTNSVAIVEAWQDAANRQDGDRLVALSHPDIEIIGPRGVGHGHQLLRDWLNRAGLQLTTLRTFTQGDVVVLAQHAVWRSLDEGAVIGEADLASRFRVDDDQVTQFASYDSLDEALAAAGLSYTDELAQR